MGLTTAYGRKLPDDKIVSMLEKVYKNGVAFWDMANLYVYLDFWRIFKLQSQHWFVSRGNQPKGPP